MVWFTLVGSCKKFGCPTAGAKIRAIVAKPHAFHFVAIYYVILVLFWGFFRCFQQFGGFFELVFHSDFIQQKSERSSRLEGFFFWLKTDYIIAKHMYTK